MTALVTTLIGAVLGWLSGYAIRRKYPQRLRTRWRCWRDGVTRQDVIAAIEAARRADDLRLAWSLSYRYRFDRCPNCAQRTVRFGGLVWTLPRNDVIAAARTEGTGIWKIKAGDSRFETVRVCSQCWLMANLPNGWFHAEIVR